jgi:hypothetical protein
MEVILEIPNNKIKVTKATLKADIGKYLLSDVAKAQGEKERMKKVWASEWPLSNPKKILTTGIRPRKSNPYLY